MRGKIKANNEYVKQKIADATELNVDIEEECPQCEKDERTRISALLLHAILLGREDYKSYDAMIDRAIWLTDKLLKKLDK